jgi:hypothetical protein
MKKLMTPNQLDLFIWADHKQNNVIDATARFEARVMSLMFGMINGHPPPIRDGKLIEAQFRRDIDRGAA